MERFSNAADALSRLAARLAGTTGRVWVQAATGEPLLFASAYRDAPELAARLTFVGVWVPGVNRTDWASLHPDGRGETTFASPDWRESLDAGRLSVHPLAYTQTWRWLADTPLDAALFQVSPPDQDGECSLGIAADFGPLIAARRLFRVAHINPLMPRVRAGPTIPLAAFDLVVEAAAPLLSTTSGGNDPVTLAVARRVAALIPDRATVQVGIGKIGTAVLGMLDGRRDLRIHSGIVGEAVLSLLDAGAVEDVSGAVTTGVAFGSSELYRRLADDPRVRFAPVPVTHGLETLAALPRLCAINSAVEVDLLGQADAETVGGRAVSGVGGLGDFLRGAGASEGGLPIVALSATARGGAVSRIVPRLTSGVVSAGRTEVGLVVTEHGVADLRALDVETRAKALIAVAAPQHREGLERAWAEWRR